RPHPRVQLLDRRLAELRRGVPDEVLPELPGILAGRVRAGRRQVDEILLEAKPLQLPAPRRFGREDDPVATAAQHVTDPDAVVGRPVRALRHEQDRQRPLAHGWLPGAAFESQIAASNRGPHPGVNTVWQVTGPAAPPPAPS